jgi:hypothetical protein
MLIESRSQAVADTLLMTNPGKWRMLSFSERLKLSALASSLTFHRLASHGRLGWRRLELEEARFSDYRVLEMSSQAHV